jgi:two-component system, NarL family, sensor histidine kinase UhpB
MSLDGMIKMLRQVANELHPPLLDSMGLHAALLAYTKELEAKTNLRIHFESPDELPALTSKQNITAYRICQESLTNVARHARADYASVSLLCLGEAITLKIQDNGIGLTDPSIESRTSFGLLGMQERAELIDGELAIRSDGGTTVILQFPVNGPKSERPEWRKPT